MDQFDLFDADLQGYKPLKVFVFPTPNWGDRLNPPIFISVCLRHGRMHNGIFWPCRRQVMCSIAAARTRRAYSALAA